MKQKNLVFVLVCVLLLLMGIPAAFAQQKTITGKVTDTKGQPVAAATVTGKGSQAATQTNPDGTFSLSVANEVKHLVITSVGFASQEIPITSQTTISVALSAATAELSEVVVTALGVERAKKIISICRDQCHCHGHRRREFDAGFAAV